LLAETNPGRFDAKIRQCYADPGLQRSRTMHVMELAEYTQGDGDVILFHIYAS